jgi:energy-coupling factor transporter ATP-binding protein EcfA2
MNSLEDGLLQWSEKQQTWKQDLLRRVAMGEHLFDKDIRMYADEVERLELEKNASLIVQPNTVTMPDFIKLDDTHLSSTVQDRDPVQITKLVHVHGANDLASGATLDFTPNGLTIIAGNNGSGKSGYTRILKQVAVSRAVGTVLPNVFGSNETPKAVITYRVGDQSSQDFTWESGVPRTKSELQRVRVFDTQTALVQLKDATEIAYIPETLQILAEFASLLQQVGEVISRDIQMLTLQSRQWPDLEIGIGSKILQHLGSAESKKYLLDIQPLTKGEKKELKSISSQLQELATSNPGKLVAQAHQRAGQLTTLVHNLNSIAESISPDTVTKSQELKKNLDIAKTTVDKACEPINDPAVNLPNTGDDLWKKMWNSTKIFVETDHQHIFPDVSDSAVCPLCQQQLDDAARNRFKQFATFMNGEAQSAFEKADELRQLDISVLQKLPFDAVQTDEIVELVNTYHQDDQDSQDSQSIGSILKSIVQDATTIRDNLTAKDIVGLSRNNLATLQTRFKNIIKTLNGVVKIENDSVASLADTDTSAAAQVKLQERRDELEIRQKIIDNRTDISAQHDRVIKIAAFQKAEHSCNTTSASKKNTELSESYVEKVCKRFEDEAKQLGISRVPVELVFDRSAHGISYIKIQLKNVPVNAVLSEGEQRIAAIAGFFADLTESGDFSTLVFDDPVSSLDQEYRVKVARRLLQEAENRQVLVFTHDYSFVQYLYEEKKLRDEQALSENKQPAQDINYLHICRSAEGTGELTTAETWRHVSIKERLGRIKQRIQDSKPIYNQGDKSSYEKIARDIVGAIRETWELFVEQDLLNGVVTRHERSVQTNRLSPLADLQESDIQCVKLGMSIESRFMTGHAAPINDGSDPLDPDELLEEENRLEKLREQIIKRRKRRGGKNA